MKTQTGTGRFGSTVRAALAWLFLLAGSTITGCRPEFQNAVVDAFESGVRGVVDAALDIYFTEVRPN